MEDGGDGGGGDGGGDGGANLGSGTVISGASSGCQVNQGSSVINYDRCMEFSLRGATVQLAYSVQQSSGSNAYIMNGAIVSSSSATNVWYAMGIPPANSGRMIGTNAIVVQALTGSCFVIDFNLAGYTFSSFTPTSNFVNNATNSLKSVITGGNTLAGTFSIFLPSATTSQTVLLAYGPVVSGLMSRHQATGRVTLDTTVTSGQGTGPLLNQGAATSPIVPSLPSSGIGVGTPVTSTPGGPNTTPGYALPVIRSSPAPTSNSPLTSTPSSTPSSNPPSTSNPSSTPSFPLTGGPTVPTLAPPTTSGSVFPSPPSAANPAAYNRVVVFVSFLVFVTMQQLMC